LFQNAILGYSEDEKGREDSGECENFPTGRMLLSDFPGVKGKEKARRASGAEEGHPDSS